MAGDVTVAQVWTLAEKYFGVLLSPPPCRRVRLKEPPSHHASLELTAASLRAAAAMEVLCKVFRGGRTCRLYKSLVDYEKLASQAM